MKYFGSLLLVAIIASVCVAARADERSDLEAANAAIAADLIIRSSPSTRTRCVDTPCLGPTQSELGLAVIAGRNTSASLKSLAELIRFRLDGGLGEDYSCVVAKKGRGLRKWLAEMNPTQVEKLCKKEYLSLTAAHSKSFPGSDSALICRSVDEIQAAQKETLEMLDSKRTCP